jgi:hypothetical protein
VLNEAEMLEAVLHREMAARRAAYHRALKSKNAAVYQCPYPTSGTTKSTGPIGSCVTPIRDSRGRSRPAEVSLPARMVRR